MNANLQKPACFTDYQWGVYLTEARTTKNGKCLDICYDCTVEYQVKMRKLGKCEHPMKRLDKISEYK